jgi:hypothetical protein
MSTIATTSAETAAALTWETKSGKTKAAWTATSALSAPVALKRLVAKQRDIQSLLNGQYRPFYHDMDALLSAKQTDELTTELSDTLSINSDGGTLVPLNPLTVVSKRATMCRLQWLAGGGFNTVNGEGVSAAPKGLKAALVSVAVEVLQLLTPLPVSITDTLSDTPLPVSLTDTPANIVATS